MMDSFLMFDSNICMATPRTRLIRKLLTPRARAVFIVALAAV